METKVNTQQQLELYSRTECLSIILKSSPQQPLYFLLQLPFLHSSLPLMISSRCLPLFHSSSPSVHPHLNFPLHLLDLLFLNPSLALLLHTCTSQLLHSSILPRLSSSSHPPILHSFIPPALLYIQSSFTPAHFHPFFLPLVHS